MYRSVLADCRRDLRYAVRGVRRNPSHALPAMFCLALAMGVNTTLFSFLDSMYFRRLPVPDAGRVVQISRERSPTCTWSEYLGFRGQLRSLDAAAWFRFGSYADIDGVNQLLSIETTSANYADVLRLRTTMGRWFTPDDDSLSSEPAIVISHHLWESQMHGDPGVLGRIVRTDVQPYRIVGVAAQGFRGVAPPISDDAWVPQASLLNLGLPADRLPVNVTARLLPGATLENARAEVRVVAARLRAGNPPDPQDDPIRVDRTSGFVWTNGRRYLKPVLLLMGLVCGMVFLIACVNVANLLLARAVSGRREIALRRSLGASRWRLFGAALTEGLVLAAGGTAMGIVLGHWTGRLLEWMLPSLPIAAYKGIEFGIDWRVLLLLGAAGLLSVILFSLPLALANGRRNLYLELNGAGGAMASRQRELYSVAQVALSLTLLIATGLLLRALGSMEAADPGFARDRRLYISLAALPNTSPPGSAVPLFTGLLEQARALPGVRNATLSSVIFGNAPRACASSSALAAPRRLSGGVVEPNYFETMRVPIVHPRLHALAKIRRRAAAERPVRAGGGFARAPLLDFGRDITRGSGRHGQGHVASCARGTEHGDSAGRVLRTRPPGRRQRRQVRLSAFLGSTILPMSACATICVVAVGISKLNLAIQA